MTQQWRERYKSAHKQYFAREYPVSFADGHYCEPVYPKVKTANGLQLAIVNFLNWSGHRAKRINNMGRLVNKVTTEASGNKFTDKRWLKSAAGRGQADISSTIFGRSCQLEVKAGRDRPSEYQLKEQAKEQAAGGVYEFIYSIEEFFYWYDRFVVQHSLT